MRVLVCGGRDYKRGSHVWDVLSEAREGYLDRLASDHLDIFVNAEPFIVMHGDCPTGADRFALSWCQDSAYRGLPTVHWPFPARWDLYGPKAGPMRNQAMLDYGRPELVLAFPGGKGTADMVRKARAAGIEVREVSDG